MLALQVAPKRAALKGAQDELAATMTSLAEAQAKLKAVEEKINMLEAQFKEATDKKEALAQQVWGGGSTRACTPRSVHCVHACKRVLMIAACSQM